MQPSIKPGIIPVFTARLKALPFQVRVLTQTSTPSSYYLFAVWLKPCPSMGGWLLILVAVQVKLKAVESFSGVRPYEPDG